MKSTLSFASLFLVLATLFGGTAQAQDSAALYFYGPAPTMDDITRAAGDASVTTNVVETWTRVTVAWPEVTVILHLDSEWRRDEQLSSIRQMLTELPAREQRKPAVKKFLADLDRTMACWGSLIDPGYDREGRVATFYKRLVATTGGFLFTYQSFYSGDGKRIAGMEGDPDTLR
ncbi:MAG TPA: hypothetical protein VM146_07400 [Steroidobacteraceae bacterium]|nr:hypothetical protein [Steroidobacteraceae bacterium]